MSFILARRTKHNFCIENTKTLWNTLDFIIRSYNCPKISFSIDAITFSFSFVMQQHRVHVHGEVDESVWNLALPPPGRGLRGDFRWRIAADAVAVLVLVFVPVDHRRILFLIFALDFGLFRLRHLFVLVLFTLVAA